MATRSKSYHAKYQSVLVNQTDMAKLREDLKMKYQDVIDTLVYNFKYIGEQAVKIARETGEYNDVTGNLRSSIGYAVLVDGQPVSGLSAQFEQRAGREGDGAEGYATAQSLLARLQGEYPTGVVLIIVAGMKYAAYVENVKHKIVLAQAQVEAEKLVKQLLSGFIK